MNRRRIVLFVLLGVVVFGSGFYFLHFREPVYQGIALSTWLEGFHSGEKETHDRAEEAVRQMGTKALPPLLKMLRANDSKLKLKLKEWAEKQSLFEVQFSSAYDRRVRAVRGFEALGPVAEPAIPSLIELFKDEEVAYGASAALIAIGPKSTLPLIKALTNENSQVRVHAAASLGDFGSDAQNVVPALIRSLKDKSSLVRNCAAFSLGVIARDPTNVVPALIVNLHYTHAEVRAAAAFALDKYGKQAKAAVPALLKALNDQDRIVRIRATSALIKIDPEGAAKAGVRFPVF